MEDNVSLCTTLFRGLIGKMLTKMIKRKFGHDITIDIVNIELKHLHGNNIHITATAGAVMSEAELLALTQKLTD